MAWLTASVHLHILGRPLVCSVSVSMHFGSSGEHEFFMLMFPEH